MISIYEEKGGLYPQEWLEFADRMHSDKDWTLRTVPGQVFHWMGGLSGEYWRNGNGNWDRSWDHSIELLWDNLVPNKYDDFADEEARAEKRDEATLFDEATSEQIKLDLSVVALLGHSNSCKLTLGKLDKIIKALLPDGDIDGVFVRLTDRTIEWLRASGSASSPLTLSPK